MQAKKVARFSLRVAVTLIIIISVMLALRAMVDKNDSVLFISVVLPALPLIVLLILLSIFTSLPTTPLVTAVYLTAIIGLIFSTILLLDGFLALPLLNYSLPGIGDVGVSSFIFNIWLLLISMGLMLITALGYHSGVLGQVGLWRKHPRRDNARPSRWAIIPFIIAMVTIYGLFIIYTVFPELAARVGAKSRIHGSLKTELPDSFTNLRLVNSFSVKHIDWSRALIRFEAASEDVANWLQSENGCFRGTTGISELVKSQWSSRLPNWWQPDIAEKYTEYKCDFVYYSRVIVDQTDDARWIVYIYADDI
ncbi:hypothetical protein SPB21_02985 [Leptothoe sp. ISB3NOV94-8A]